MGAILLALLAAYTFGTLGSEMSFTDRMLIAGRAASVWIIGAGVIFELGNMLLLASITLLGMAPAFAACFGTAAAITAAIYIGRFHPFLMAGAMACLLLCITCGLVAAGWRQSQPVKQPVARNHRVGRVTAVSLAVVSGLAFGGLQFVLKFTSDPEFGPGPYASILMLAVGILISTPAFDFFFTNIRVTGSPISVKLYAQGGLRPHLPGFASGAIWALGTVALLLALTTTGDQAPRSSLVFLFPVSSVIVCIFLGLFRWKEIPAPRSRAWLWLALVSFAAGCVLIGYGLAK